MPILPQIPPRGRKVKVLATLGPASNTPEMIAALHSAGADAFRINMSHGRQEEKAALVSAIRDTEVKVGRPIAILFDLQGPKLRVGDFDGGSAMLESGQRFVLDQDPAPGDASRAEMPHPELFATLKAGDRLLIDDGKVRLTATSVTPERIEAKVEVGGKVSNHKGVNVPDVVVPIPALTDKDKDDLQFALSQGADYIALSFVQRPEDVAEARELVGDKAALLAKIEKPQAIDRLDEILKLADAVMVARGDLGVELPPEGVPPLQNRIVAAARLAGKPVVVATQMLESMITAPTPTRAEVSDVATAIYDGADAVMLSAESAAGQYPLESVSMMDRIAKSVEHDPAWAARVHFTKTPPQATTADALSRSAHEIVGTVNAVAMACFTSSGSTARRMARQRSRVPIMAMTDRLDVARRLGLLWGCHAVQTRDVASFEEMVGKARRMALRHELAGAGDRIVIMAGVPFGISGSTNVIHVVKLDGSELEGYGREA